jgi:hypothetical protein
MKQIACTVPAWGAAVLRPYDGGDDRCRELALTPGGASPPLQSRKSAERFDEPVMKG